MADFKAPSKPLFYQLCILDIFNVNALEVGTFVYSCYNGPLTTFLEQTTKLTIILES